MSAYAVFAVGLAALSTAPPYVTPLWTMIASGLCGAAVLATRRRHPLLSFVGAIVLWPLSLAVGSGAESMLIVIALYSAATSRSAPRAWLCFGAAVISGGLGAFALAVRGNAGPPILGLGPSDFPRDTLLDWANVYAIIVVALLIVTLLGTNAGHRRRHMNDLLDRAERLAHERDQQVEIARALERERIAREMHDVIAHSLSVIIAVADGAHAAIEERPEKAKEAIGRVAETGRRTLGEVRRLLGNVRGEDSTAGDGHTPQPDVSQLVSLAAEFVTAGLPVRLVVTGAPSVDPVLGLAVYRIVQESLTNVLRHARRVRSATVTVTWTSDDVSILVRDVGSMVTSPSDAGRGLLGMRERVALYDGFIEAGPHEDGGWRVFARLRWGER